MVKTIHKPDDTTLYLDDQDKVILAVQDFPIYDKDNPGIIIGY